MKTTSDFKILLEQEKKRLIELLERTHRHLIKDEPISADFAEQANETNNDQVVEALDFEARQEVAQIKRALKRIENGSFGTCVSCDEDIQSKRLEAIPYVANCIACATKLERAGALGMEFS